MHEIRFPLGELTEPKSPDGQTPYIGRGVHSIEACMDMDAPSAAYLLEKNRGGENLAFFS